MTSLTHEQRERLPELSPFERLNAILADANAALLDRDWNRFDQLKALFEKEKAR